MFNTESFIVKWLSSAQVFLILFFVCITFCAFKTPTLLFPLASSSTGIYWHPLATIQPTKSTLGWHTFIKSRKNPWQHSFSLSSFAAMSDFHVRLFRSKGLAKIEPCAAPLKKKYLISHSMIYHNYAD